MAFLDEILFPENTFCGINFCGRWGSHFEQGNRFIFFCWNKHQNLLNMVERALCHISKHCKGCKTVPLCASKQRSQWTHFQFLWKYYKQRESFAGTRECWYAGVFEQILSTTETITVGLAINVIAGNPWHFLLFWPLLLYFVRFQFLFLHRGFKMTKVNKHIWNTLLNKDEIAFILAFGCF